MELTPEERRLAEKLFNKIQRQRREDRKNEHYYQGLQEIGNLGIAVPPDVQPFAFPLNWCRTYIDVLEERQDVRMLLRSGALEEDAELRADWEANDLDSLSHLVHRDLLIYGRAFISVAARDGGGRPRIMPESPKDIAALVDARTREMTAALRIYRDDTGIAEYMTLYLPDSTVLIDRRAGKWEATRRIKHRLGRVPLVMILNRQRTGEWAGETQLADLRPLVDMAGRVMLQLQLAMETVATPQKVALGVTQKDFVDADGNQIEDPWETYLGAIWAISSKDAKIEQLSGAQLTGFHDTIKMLAEQAATVTGLPVRMMGQNTVNPRRGRHPRRRIPPCETGGATKHSRRCWVGVGARHRRADPYRQLGSRRANQYPMAKPRHPHRVATRRCAAKEHWRQTVHVSARGHGRDGMATTTHRP